MEDGKGIMENGMGKMDYGKWEIKPSGVYQGSEMFGDLLARIKIIVYL
ncbi:hypothetical protein [Pedobacter sp. N23S346]